jgi:MIP family channel proteins
MASIRPELAEALGVFFLVLVGGGAILAGANSLAVALAFGLVVAALIYALGHLCGAHYNPAVTIAFAATGHFPWRRVPGYAAAQVVGATLAAFALRFLFGRVGAVTTRIGTGLGLPAAILTELLASFLLGLVIVAVATDRRTAPGAAGLAIGLTVAVNSLWAGPLTGASANPARSLGPAIAANSWGGILLFLFVPVAGACLGMLCYEALRSGRIPRHEDTLGALGPFPLEEGQG